MEILLEEWDPKVRDFIIIRDFKSCCIPSHNLSKLSVEGRVTSPGERQSTDKRGSFQFLTNICIDLLTNMPWPDKFYQIFQVSYDRQIIDIR